MPLLIAGRVPPHLTAQPDLPVVASANLSPVHSAEFSVSSRPDAGLRPEQGLRIALINNMPDAALEDTELQFCDLLSGAAASLPVQLKLYSLPGIPRTDRGQRHLDSFYHPFDELWQDQLDGVIITGTEPRQPNLRDEPYWNLLAEVFDWAERNTAAAVLSCLAAHAGVLHSDGIARHPLSDKQFGVFSFDTVADHPFVNGGPQAIRFPHSRWNEVRKDVLLACGYSVLTQSAEGGVDTFVKKKKKSLFLHFQGHPEYRAETLLKEYRRDVRRFLRQERDTFPGVPKNYFSRAGESLAADFRQSVLAQDSGGRREEFMESFPDAALAGSLQNSWHSSAVSIYRNWLGYMASRKADTPKPSSAAIHDRMQGSDVVSAKPS